MNFSLQLGISWRFLFKLTLNNEYTMGDTLRLINDLMAVLDTHKRRILASHEAPADARYAVQLATMIGGTPSEEETPDPEDGTTSPDYEGSGGNSRCKYNDDHIDSAMMAMLIEKNGW